MSLVVVHRDDEVVVASAGDEEDGVGWQRPAGVDPVGLQPFDRRSDLLLLLAVALLSACKETPAPTTETAAQAASDKIAIKDDVPSRLAQLPKTERLGKL